MKYILSIGLALFLFSNTGAQVSRFVPSQIKIGTDLSLAGLSILNADIRQFEISGDIDIHNYFISVDYGNSVLGFDETGYSYDNRGNYFRAGVDYNFIGSNQTDHVIYFGLRYASADFRESFEYSINDAIYGDYQEIINTDGSGRWFEAVTGLKAKVWKNIHLGWTVRFKFGKNVDSSSSIFNNFRVPGYGSSSSDSQWGLNYQIFYRIPIREKKVPVEAPDENGSDNI